jgi:two-component system, OmpR family, alkaline phosphatase synthesis response regulator PhoP
MSALAIDVSVPVPPPRMGTAERILVISDEITSCNLLNNILAAEGYRVEVVPDRMAGLQLLSQKPFSAVILDLQHPGWDLCREIANAIAGLPLVVLTPSLDVTDKVLHLEMGADDYLATPFNPKELVARLRALMRRVSRGTQDNFVVFDDVTVDFFKSEITRAGKKVRVTNKEFKIVEFLIRNAERVIPRDELLNEVWGYECYPCTRTVDTHIRRLREKLESDPSHPLHLLTVHAVGYKFVP